MLEAYDEVPLKAPRTPEQRKNRQCRYVEQDQYLRMHGPTQFQLVTNTTGKVGVVLSQVGTFA